MISSFYEKTDTLDNLLLSKFKNWIRSSKQPRSSVTLLITEMPRILFEFDILFNDFFLPNLKKIFDGQSTGLDEHVLSFLVQHWIE